MGRRKINREEVVKLYKQGKSISELAKEFNVSRQAIYNALGDLVKEKLHRDKQEKEKIRKQLKEYVLEKVGKVKYYKNIEEFLNDKLDFDGLEKIDENLYKAYTKTDVYLISFCKNTDGTININLILQKEKNDCNFINRYDLYIKENFYKLLLKFIDIFNGDLSKKDIDYLISEDYLIDLSIIDKKNYKFQIRVRHKNKNRQITLFNSTRKDILEVAKQMAKMKRIIVRGFTQIFE